MPVSFDNLVSEFRDIDPSDAYDLARQIREAEQASSDREREQILERANHVIQGHGLEEIRGTKAPGGFWGSGVAQYVNTGDTYTPTILYDTVKRKFFLTSFGDFVEKHDEDYGIRDYEEGRHGNPSGKILLPAKLKYVGNFVANLAPDKLVKYVHLPHLGEHMLTAKADERLSIMSGDLETLLRLGLVRIQVNAPGEISFYFEE